MSDRKIRVVSDCYNEYKDGYGMYSFGGDVIPVDMNGRRVWPSKEKSNLQEASQDIQEYYGLTGKKGFS